MRYDLTAGTKEGSSDHLLQIWAYEARRLFRDKMVGTEGLNKFDSILMSTIRADWSANIFDNLDGNNIDIYCNTQNICPNLFSPSREELLPDSLYAMAAFILRYFSKFPTTLTGFEFPQLQYRLYILYENVYLPLFWIRPLSIGQN